MQVLQTLDKKVVVFLWMVELPAVITIGTEIKLVENNRTIT